MSYNKKFCFLFQFVLECTTLAWQLLLQNDGKVEKGLFKYSLTAHFCDGPSEINAHLLLQKVVKGGFGFTRGEKVYPWQIEKYGI